MSPSGSTISQSFLFYTQWWTGWGHSRLSRSSRQPSPSATILFSWLPGPTRHSVLPFMLLSLSRSDMIFPLPWPLRRHKIVFTLESISSHEHWRSYSSTRSHCRGGGWFHQCNCRTSFWYLQGSPPNDFRTPQIGVSQRCFTPIFSNIRFILEMFISRHWFSIINSCCSECSCLFESSWWWDAYFYKGDGGETAQDHSSRTKSFVCGSFPGVIQALVICPLEHVKCRLQVQKIASGAVGYKTSWDDVDKIFTKHGVRGLYRGFACTAWRWVFVSGFYPNHLWTNLILETFGDSTGLFLSTREIPAFGLYFSCYDPNNSIILPTPNQDPNKTNQCTLSPHEWASSALAEGCSGALTWHLSFRRNQNSHPNDTFGNTIIATANVIYRQHGWTHLFRGLGVTLIRAFPVKGFIFPVYDQVGSCSFVFGFGMELLFLVSWTVSVHNDLPR